MAKISHRLLHRDMDQVGEDEGHHRVGHDSAEHVLRGKCGGLANGKESICGDDNAGDVEAQRELGQWTPNDRGEKAFDNCCNGGG